MDNSKELKDHERIVKQIAQTSDSIRKMYHVLKSDKIEEDIALEKYLNPIVELLKQIVENTVGEESQPKEANAKDRKKKVNKENQKKMKKTMMNMIMMMMVTISGWLIHTLINTVV